MHQWDETTGKIKVYINGILKGTVNDTTDDSFSTFFLGARNGTQFWWKGIIDEVRIYNRALSASEIIAEQFTYDQTFNKVTTHTDPLGNVTSYFYYPDGKGDLQRVDYPEVGGQIPQTFYTYNTRGQMQTVTDAEDIVTKYEYDGTYAWLKKTIVDFGDVTHLNIETNQDYYSNGDLNWTKDPLNNTTTYTYYNNHLPDITTLPAPFNNQTVDNDYDEDGNLKKKGTGIVGTLWQEVQYTYTFSGKKATAVDPLGNTTTYEYDNLDRLWKTTDAESKVTENKYYPDGKLKEIIDARTVISVHYDYDENGNVVLLRDAKGNETVYTFSSTQPIFHICKLSYCASYCLSKYPFLVLRKGCRLIKIVYR